MSDSNVDLGSNISSLTNPTIQVDREAMKTQRRIEFQRNNHEFLSKLKEKKAKRVSLPPKPRLRSSLSPFFIPMQCNPDGSIPSQKINDLKNKTTTDVVHYQDLIDIMEELLPSSPKEVMLYHYPSRGDCNHLIASTFVLCIEPSQTMYQEMSKYRHADVTFIHRPFQLERYRVPRFSAVLSSHYRFDELLTTGWNPRLALKLGLNQQVFCIKGFKEDPERKIGLIGSYSEPKGKREFLSMIAKQFGGGEIHWGEDHEKIKNVAILNAFSQELIEDIVNGFSEKIDVIITGEMRQNGLEESKRRGITNIIAVGHEPSEYWGIKELRSIYKDIFGDRLNVKDL
eukprot:TRINITY_DN11261_c0_g1_i1.p1 TRINITY_DN11261_c0_g1~~TRINITY_DN11261_c0_g1_i1.p1  ORF type:complete len:386 (-),score=133.12 TRINITY_DN11261_c0_g1_i1:310-1335(-)